MKKILGLMATVLMLGSFFLAVPVIAGDGSTLDQSYEASWVGYYKVGAGHTVQTFTPTKNRISSIDLSFDHRQTSSNLKLTVKEVAGGTEIGSETHMMTFAGDTAWETFVFSPNLVVVPGTLYEMILEDADGNDNTTYWRYSDKAPTYDRGSFLDVNGVQKPFDMLFREYGKDIVTGEPVAPKATVATVDDSLKVPALASIKRGGIETLAPIEKEIVLGSTDKLTLSGTSFAGAKVVIIIGEKTITATTALNGTWTITVDAATLEKGDYTVYGQAQVDAKGSDRAELLKVKVLGVKTGTEVAAGSWISNWNIFYVLVAVGILLLVLLLLALMARRHHQEKTGTRPKKEKKAVKEETVVEGEPEEEEKEQEQQ